MTDNDSGIKENREQIDLIDKEIVELLSRRAEHARTINTLKKAGGDKGGFSPEREESVYKALQKDGKSPFPPKALTAVFSEIISACRNLVKTGRVAVLGEKSGWVHDAAVFQFGSQSSYSAMEDVRDLLECLQKNDVEVGFVPLLSSSGDFGYLVEAFLSDKLKILSEVQYVPTFSFVSRHEGDISEMTDLFVTREILSLMKSWVTSLSFPLKINICRTVDETMENLVENQPFAGLVPQRIAKIHDIRTLSDDLRPDIVSPARCLAVSPTGNQELLQGMKGSALFSLPAQPGALKAFLEPLSEMKLNLVGIQLVPFLQKPWGEIFLADFEVPADSKKLASLLQTLESRAKLFRFLGFYPFLKRN